MSGKRWSKWAGWIFILIGVMGISLIAAFANPFEGSPPQETPNTPSATYVPPTSTATLPPTATPTHTPTPTRTPTSTPTRTPTPPMPTNTPGHLPWPEITASPTLTGSLPIPTIVPTVYVPPDAITVVVLGSDRRRDWDDWHTDVVQIVSIQPDVPAVTVLSVPRDLYVYIPELWMSRINFADMYGELYGYEGGSPALVKDTLEYNLGFRPDYYVRTDFDGLISIVNLLGGIDVPVHCTLSDHWPYPDENGEYPMLTLEPGVHHMDGETALWYARSRKTTSVFSRERRQQQILQAIWREARRQNLLPHVPQLWETSQSMVQTDMDFATIVNLAAIGFQLNESAVRYRSISYSHVTPWTTPQGGNVFLPNWEELEPVLQEALGPVPEARRANVAPYVEVWNGTPNTGYGSLAADRLYRAGYNAVLGIADGQSYTQTQILIFAENDKGLGLGWLQWKFGVSDDRVSHTPDPNQPYPLRLIIGADYEPCDPNF